jgi:hypothetical protein
MSGILNSDLIDLQKTTLENLPSMDFEVALNSQEYNVINDWFRSEKIQVESGTSIVRNIILDTSGNARHVRLYQKSSINVGDVQKRITAPWVQVESQYSIERREALRNRKPAMYISLLKSRRLDGMLSLADLLETRAWLSPEDVNDDLNPRGLPYWLSKVVPTNGTGYSATIDVPGALQRPSRPLQRRHRRPDRQGWPGPDEPDEVPQLGGHVHGHRRQLRPEDA